MVLNRAFAQIRDPKLRRKLIELVRELGGDTEPDGEVA
jgi:hypothetical protein